MRVASFDIGKKNFAFYIEQFDENELLKLKNIPENQRYNSDGTPTKSMKQLLDSVCLNGKTILHRNIDISEPNPSSKYSLNPKTFLNLTKILDEYINEWDKCNVFIIEKQMEFAGKNLNIPAVKLGQHCFSYFTIIYGSNKEVIEFSAQYKGKILGTPKVINEKKPVFKNGKPNYISQSKPKRKKFAVKQATEILEKRNENYIKTVKKKDDLADTFLQLQAFKYLVFVDKVANI